VKRKLEEFGWFLRTEMQVPYRTGWSDAWVAKRYSQAWTLRDRPVEKTVVGVGGGIEAHCVSQSLALAAWVRPK